jgi:outer membrane immunogenic protein
MRKLAAAGLFIAMLSHPAGAGDLGPQPPPGVYSYPPVIRLYTWNGVYVGGHIGAGWNDTLISETNGFLGGAQVGFNARVGRAVYGLEAQWTGSGDNGDDDASIELPGGITGTFTSEIDWLTTLTARAGLAWDRSLFYVRGGAAWARNTYHGAIDGVGFDGGETRSGWALGLGYEYAFRNAWSTRIEYTFMDFGSETVGLSGAGGSIAVPDVDQQIHAVTLSVNYRFDWPTLGPVGPD